MTFEQFASLHGLRITSLVFGRWVRVPTEDKPRKRNGAYKLMDGVGFVQNHATMTDVAVWHPDAEAEAPKIDRELIAMAARETARNREEAAKKAAAMLAQSTLARHPYFASKGFADHDVNVFDGKALIPMRIGTRIVGCQLIDESGGKKFLFGQESGGAEFVMHGGGTHVVCEGYATGLSVRKAFEHLKAKATIHVCFSAGNMVKVAKGLPRGLVIADNDASGTGERVANEIGWPYWMSGTVGEDCNDFHQRAGLFKMAMQLRAAMRS